MINLIKIINYVVTTYQCKKYYTQHISQPANAFVTALFANIYIQKFFTSKIKVLSGIKRRPVKISFIEYGLHYCSILLFWIGRVQGLVSIFIKSNFLFIPNNLNLINGTHTKSDTNYLFTTNEKYNTFVNFTPFIQMFVWDWKYRFEGHTLRLKWHARPAFSEFEK